MHLFSMAFVYLVISRPRADFINRMRVIWLLNIGGGGISNSVKSIVSCCEVFWVKPVEWWYGISKEKWFGSLSDSEAKVHTAVTVPPCKTKDSG